MALAARAITEREQAYRSAPQNIEAEQALLGAILVNNEAFYRVSDFLDPNHFFEPVHRRIYQVAGELIRANKIANPVTIKTFLPADLAIGDITLNQYLARLAAEATTIINAEDYGRSVYDLALRRALIGIGEDMVNVAYDAPVEMSPKEQIEEAEKRLYEVAEKGQFDSGFQSFDVALVTAIDMASAAYKRDGHLSGLATGLTDMDRQMGGLQASDLIILAGRPGMGKSALATNMGFNIAKAWRGEVQPDGTTKTANGGIVGFFSLEMSSEQLATRIIAEQSGVPSSDIRRGRINEDQFAAIVAAAREMNRIPFYLDQTGGLTIGQLVGARPPAQAPARPRPPDHRLHPAPPGILARRATTGSRKSPRSPTSSRRLAKELQCSDPGPFAALPTGREPRRQASPALRPPRIRLDRAGRRRGHVRLSRGVLSQEQGAEARHHRIRDSGRTRCRRSTASPR